jgi:hypothetical protein
VPAVACAGGGGGGGGVQVYRQSRTTALPGGVGGDRGAQVYRQSRPVTRMHPSNMSTCNFHVGRLQTSHVRPGRCREKLTSKAALLAHTGGRSVHYL